MATTRGRARGLLPSCTATVGRAHYDHTTMCALLLTRCAPRKVAAAHGLTYETLGCSLQRIAQKLQAHSCAEAGAVCRGDKWFSISGPNSPVLELPDDLGEW